MTFPDKKKLVVALIVIVSVLFNIYILVAKHLDNVRMDGYKVAILGIMEAAKSEKEVTLKFEDKDGNSESVLLKLIEPTQANTTEIPKQ